MEEGNYEKRSIKGSEHIPNRILRYLHKVVQIRDDISRVIEKEMYAWYGDETTEAGGRIISTMI